MTNENFIERHIGLGEGDIKQMLSSLGFNSLDDLTNKIIPKNIQLKQFHLCDALSEVEAIHHITEISEQNGVYKNFIGQGYYNTILPAVIKRNILENPSWYTAYTPYQAEISQGRMEALINFQTLISELTAMEVSNASLLDEGSACAEAMVMAKRISYKNDATKNTFVVDQHIFRSSLEVLKTRAKSLDIHLVITDVERYVFDHSCFGCLIQTPNKYGDFFSLQDIQKKIHAMNGVFIVSTDLSFLCLFKPPGEFDADIVVGSTQRFGLPLGYGGPHSAFMATKKSFVREMPGRIIGVSKDSMNNIAYRMTLQTREQHIRRDKANSNICTAQVLLAILSSFYAIYHGKNGLIEMANTILKHTHFLRKNLINEGFEIINKNTFDTITIKTSEKNILAIKNRSEEKKMNLNYFNSTTLSFSIDETHTLEDCQIVLEVITGSKKNTSTVEEPILSEAEGYDTLRKNHFLNQPIFHFSKSETEILRYVKHLEKKDFSLCQGMIPLGSCTMKLNATTEMLQISFPKFAHIHPFAPQYQTKGYLKIINELGEYLKKITGFSAVTFQPNSGATGEYVGLLMMKNFFEKNNQKERKKILIPISAHGTNPASAVMCGFDVVGIQCDEYGNIDLKDVEKKCLELKNELAGIMLTYPSTHGVFEENITDITKIIHQNGGLVYMDGANMNAQVGLTSPTMINADVCHINLHKTFSIPHGGGGPGMGPVLSNEKLAPYIPSHYFLQPPTEKDNNNNAVSSAPYSSSLILTISYMYMKLLGTKGCRMASQIAILNANYLRLKLQSEYKILYSDKNGFVAHEFIIDLREFKKTANLDAVDIAKRLIDYGFHPPTVSFPVAGTIMIEPTESESKEELDRFIEAMLSIKKEIKEIEENKVSKDVNVLKLSPFPIERLLTDKWMYPFSREQAAFPLPNLKVKKHWPTISRIDDVFGDRNIFCSCPTMEQLSNFNP